MKNKASPIFKFNLENYTHDCGSRKDFSKYKTPTKQHGKSKQIHKTKYKFVIQRGRRCPMWVFTTGKNGMKY